MKPLQGKLPRDSAMVFSDQILLFCFRFKCWFMHFKMDVILYFLGDLHPDNRCLLKTLCILKDEKERNFSFKMMKARCIYILSFYVHTEIMIFSE